MKETNWIEERKASELKEAMRSAVKAYARIEKKSLILNSLDRIFESEGIDLEKLINGNWYTYIGNSELQLYCYRDEDASEILIAMVAELGEAKREKVGEQIAYTWKKALYDYDIKLQVNPAATGCKLVAKTVRVPSVPRQAATTRIEYEIACTEEVILAD